VCIYRLETEPAWSLEVVNSAGTSTVWDDLFSSDDEANEEFLRTVTEEGMTTFLDNAKVVGGEFSLKLQSVSERDHDNAAANGNERAPPEERLTHPRVAPGGCHQARGEPDAGYNNL
jgi:hypothetical protein